MTRASGRESVGLRAAIYTDPVTMLPVQDVVPSRTTPRITITLAALLVGAFTIERLLPEQTVRGMILAYGPLPAHAPWWSLLVFPFLHHGVIEVAANAGALWIFGDNVEDRLGRLRFALLFAAGVSLGSLAASWFDPSGLRLMIGAAGGVGAVAGAHLLLFRQARVLVLVPARPLVDLVEVPSVLVVLGWIVLVGLAPTPFAGLGIGLPLPIIMPAAGLATGALLARVLARPERLACAWWNVPLSQFPERRRTSRDTSASSVSNASN